MALVEHEGTAMHKQDEVTKVMTFLPGPEDEDKDESEDRDEEDEDEDDDE